MPTLLLLLLMPAEFVLDDADVLLPPPAASPLARVADKLLSNKLLLRSLLALDGRLDRFVVVVSAKYWEREMCGNFLRF